MEREGKNEPHNFGLEWSHIYNVLDGLTDIINIFYFYQGLIKETEVLGIIYNKKFILEIKSHIIMTFDYAVYIRLLLLPLMLGQKSTEQAVKK